MIEMTSIFWSVFDSPVCYHMAKDLYHHPIGNTTVDMSTIGYHQMDYPLVNVYITNWKAPPYFMGKFTIHGSFP